MIRRLARVVMRRAGDFACVMLQGVPAGFKPLKHPLVRRAARYHRNGRHALQRNRERKKRQDGHAARTNHVASV